ncbi:hypothetical protein [Bradyrhizobium iriomotense]|uniref:hypothetical protein n=1 Tax=Bradyrhizobium iriomotense TaxID=441950 RepID=UPI0024E0D556|nr:hypothetical protein [Bradyrhizobium iriomotense]
MIDGTNCFRRSRRKNDRTMHLPFGFSKKPYPRESGQTIFHCRLTAVCAIRLQRITIGLARVAVKATSVHACLI